ncbi:hypothetical protein VMCG_10877 [Cytospora schulzeri]|uniref:Uncharacterized protein n=1 Tax=Cytospora schulzeri TaxID=448051 RepID=A0A423V859_9PEZI|nr:hypothetical protein VMCG_10877 [Valsa malicola]
MATVHRPDFEAFKKESRQGRDVKSPPKEPSKTTVTRDLDTLNKPLSTLYFGLSPGGNSGSSNKLDEISPLEDLNPADFLHALTCTGFTAEKLYGSVWQFRPTALDVERSIQFHQPHPRGKIPLRIARRHGRRLNRAYGWFGGMFVLKKG